MSKKNPKILIIGTGSLLNYGCEAIVRGTYEILKAHMPDCRIFVASDDLDYDRRILPEDIELVTYKRRFSPYRIFKGILRRVFHIGNGSAVRINTNIGKKYDIVLSAGGDNYCEAPDGSLYYLLLDLMTIGRKAHKKGKKYILWGASVGPFSEQNENIVIKNLGLTDAICTREELSYNYLSRFSETKAQTHLVADPAFCMRPVAYEDFTRESGKTYIGLNISILAIAHSKIGDNNAFIKTFAQRCDAYLESHPQTIFVLIPHVQQTAAQDDYTALEPLLAYIEHKEQCVLIPKGIGSAKTKGLVSQLDLLMAARMHCCVAGISTATPTMFIAYSNKGRGMAEYAYGHQQYNIEVKDMITDKMDATLDMMLEKKEEIKAHLEQQHERFVSEAMEAGKYI